MGRRVLVIHGPNLNLLGSREPHLYGSTTLEALNQSLQEIGRQASPSITVETFQSNHEGALIDFLQAEAGAADAVLINAGAFGHYSIALRDALVATRLPVVDVHISNVYAREPFRHHSVIADIATAQVTGLGWRGYLAALEALIENLHELRR